MKKILANIKFRYTKDDMEKITIKDIARLAGVSVATVSYIINGKHENRRRIRNGKFCRS